jgi:hypothetical protein
VRGYFNLPDKEVYETALSGDCNSTERHVQPFLTAVGMSDQSHDSVSEIMLGQHRSNPLAHSHVELSSPVRSLCQPPVRKPLECLG